MKALPQSAFPSPSLRILKVSVDSPRYARALALRNELLRRPLGLTFSAEDAARDRRSDHLVGEIGDQLVCCLVLDDLGGAQVQMRQVVVATSYQGRGLGRQLIGEAERICSTAGSTMLFAHARHIVVPFYQKLGYECYGPVFEEVSIEHQAVRKSLLPLD